MKDLEIGLTKLSKNKFVIAINYNSLRGKNVIDKKASEKNTKILSKEFIKENKINKQNLNKNIDKDFAKIIREFIDVLENNLPHCDFQLLNKKIETLKVNTVSCLKHAYGSYFPKDNIIILDLSYKNKTIKDTLIHELLHMASFSGFDQLILVNKRKLIEHIGIGLNEGYTVLLCERYFNINAQYTYEFLKHFSKSLEKIIGKEKMEYLYFSKNLYGLINELKNYEKNNLEILNFIKALDSLCKNFDSINPIKNMKVIQNVILINSFLITTYMNKLKMSELSNEEKENKLNEFIKKLGNKRVSSLYNYKYIFFNKKYEISFCNMLDGKKLK